VRGHKGFNGGLDVVGVFGSADCLLRPCAYVHNLGTGQSPCSLKIVAYLSGDGGVVVDY